MVDTLARRLLVGAALRLHVARRLGAGTPCRDLLGAARILRMPGDELERTSGLTFEPDYPGESDGPRTVRGGQRLVLTCRASHHGEPAADVVTTLILGRPPQVAAAPVGTAGADRPAGPPG